MISVMMDVTDGEDFLGDALASLSGQSFRDFEIVLCAHGATPGTAAVLRTWQDREPRLRISWCERLPLSEAHNRCADMARAPILARLDADDIALPDRLERQFEAMRREPRRALLGCATELIDGRGRVLGRHTNPESHREIAAAIPHACPILHSTMMIHAAAFERAGRYRAGLNISEDYDLYARVLETAEAYNLPDALVQYRVHSASLTSRNPAQIAMANLCVGAAALARRNRMPEPFINGVPSLRLAAETLGLERTAVRRRVRATGWQSRVSRRMMMYPGPLRVGSRMRALLHKLGARRLFGGLFHSGVYAVDAIRTLSR